MIRRSPDWCDRAQRGRRRCWYRRCARGMIHRRPDWGDLRRRGRRRGCYSKRWGPPLHCSELVTGAHVSAFSVLSKRYASMPRVGCMVADARLLRGMRIREAPVLKQIQHENNILAPWHGRGTRRAAHVYLSKSHAATRFRFPASVLAGVQILSRETPLSCTHRCCRTNNLKQTIRHYKI